MPRSYSISVVAAFLICCTAGALQSSIELGQDGRYTGILVSIDKALDADWELLNKLKAAFQQASVYLAEVTKPVMSGTKSYAFGSVKFLLPPHWVANGSGFRAASDAAAVSEDEAHFRVHAAGGDEPWTAQPFGCGQPGLFTILPRAFIKDSMSLAQSLIHEFAHLRWGVFDEYNGPDGPHGYWKNRRMQPVRCSESLLGIFAHNVTGAGCKVDPTTNMLEPHCRFIVRDSQPIAKASTMYVSYIDSVRQFCATVADAQLAHNRDSPNPHNTNCLGASVRDVLVRHADFQSGPEITDPDTRINFTEVLPRVEKRLVVVMDVSRSMRGEPMEKMKQSMQSLLHQLDDDVHVALIAFSTDVRVLMPLGPINGSVARQLYWLQVANLTAYGVTATGDALAAAMELLGCNLTEPAKHHSGQILLITDGEENSRVRYGLDDIIDIARRTSVTINTVAFGSLADARLASLSAATGGTANFARFLGPVNDMAEVLAHSSPGGRITLASCQQLEGNSSHKQLSVSVDESARFGLQFFVVSASRPAEIRLRLVTPAGDTIEGRSDPVAGVEFDGESQLGSAVLRFKRAVQIGEWQMHADVATGSESQTAATATSTRLSAIVTAAREATSSDWRPTILRGFLSHPQASLSASSRVSVHAYLMRDHEFVRPADLWARVESEGGLIATLRLHDHGAGADVLKGDGIYSAYLPLDLMTIARDYGVSVQCLGPVSRVGSAGKFTVSGVDPGELAKLPPARVTDLDCSVSIASGAVHLSWTAVGDRLDSGTAGGYQIKSSASRDELTNNFDSADNVTVPTVVPLSAGQLQTLEIAAGQMANYSGTFYMAVKAVSTAGLLSDLSNVIAAQLSLPENLDAIEHGVSSTTLPSSESSTASSQAPTSSTTASQAPTSSTTASQAPTSSTTASQAPTSSTTASQAPTSSTTASQAPTSSTTASQAPTSSTTASQAPTSGTASSQALQTSSQLSTTAQVKSTHPSSQVTPRLNTDSTNCEHSPCQPHDGINWTHIGLILGACSAAIACALAGALAIIRVLRQEENRSKRRNAKVAPIP